MTQFVPVSPEQSRGISRRTLVTTAAWSVPVVGLAVAAPAASATVVPTFAAIPDVRSGDTGIWFDGDTADNKTTYNVYPSPSIPALSNVGTTSTPTGLVFSFTWDSRVFGEYTFTGAELFAPDEVGVTPVALGPSDITFLGSTAGTNKWTTVFSVNIPIPVGRGIRLIGSRPLVEEVLTNLVTFNDLVPIRYEVIAPSGSANSESGVLETTPQLLPFNRWDVDPVAVFTPSDVDGCSVPLPDYLDVTAAGPFPIPVGTRFQMSVDSAVVTAVGDAVATIDGTVAPGFFVADGGFEGSVIYRSWRSTAEVPVGSVIRFSAPLTIAPSRAPGQFVEASTYTISTSDPNFGAGQLQHESAAMSCPIP